jgi:hypothetical protein
MLLAGPQADGQAGEEFDLVSKDGCGDGWWLGSARGRTGVFPSNYVRELAARGTDEDI